MFVLFLIFSFFSFFVCGDLLIVVIWCAFVYYLAVHVCSRVAVYLVKIASPNLLLRSIGCLIF